jgi:hypothetical protein
MSVHDIETEGPRREGGKGLDVLLLDGLDSGDPLPVDAEFWSSLKQEALARLEPARNQPGHSFELNRIRVAISQWLKPTCVKPVLARRWQIST